MQTLEVLRHFTARDEVRVERREQYMSLSPWLVREPIISAPR